MPRLHEQTIIPICRHIRTNGIRCRSAAVSGQDFCYFHNRLHQDHPAPLTAQQIVSGWKEEHVEAFRRVDQDPMTIARAYPRQNELNFPPLEDPESVQLAGSMLFHAIAQAQIHPLRARLLLKALGIVSVTLGKGSPTDTADPSEFVQHVTESEAGVLLAEPALAPHFPPATPAE